MDAVDAALAELDELGIQEDAPTDTAGGSRGGSAAVEAAARMLFIEVQPPPPPPPPPATTAPAAAAAPTAAAPAVAAEDEWTFVGAASTAAFLLKCAKAPDRFFYPCNAKHRDTPARCTYAFQRATRCEEGAARVSSSAASSSSSSSAAGPAQLSIRLAECEYSEGGTGWRVWPCALLLSCWLVANEARLQLLERRASALELGCGLGLPGLAAAALGARDVALTDCLPVLLSTIRRSVAANREGGVGVLPAASASGASPAPGSAPPPLPCPPGRSFSNVRVASLDWDDEAPVRDAALAAKLAVEEFSTEQGVKAAQLKQHRAAGGGAEAGGGGDGGGEVSTACATLGADERFGLVLASDVVYSLTHATQLPEIIAQRLETRSCADGGGGTSGGDGGTLAAMVPVRSEEHTRAFLGGMHAKGMRVLISRVDAAWVAAVVAPQRTAAAKAATAARPGAEIGADELCSRGVAFEPGMALAEGEILFVEATLK